METDKFDLDKASKETMKIVVAGVQRYEKDLGLEGRNFNASLQQQLAMDLARDIERKIRNKEL